MVDDKKEQGRWERFLRLKHTGKLIAIVNTAIYSLASYFTISWLKEMIGSTDSAKQSIGIILLVAFIALLVWVRDLISDTIDKQSSVNKERDEHEKTKEKLKNTDGELIECRRMLHAIRSNISNTIMSEPTDEAKIQKITSIMMKINIDPSVNNIAENPNNGIQKDYIALFI